MGLAASAPSVNYFLQTLHHQVVAARSFLCEWFLDSSPSAAFLGTFLHQEGWKRWEKEFESREGPHPQRNCLAREVNVLSSVTGEMVQFFQP